MKTRHLCGLAVREGQRRRHGAHDTLGEVNPWFDADRVQGGQHPIQHGGLHARQRGRLQRIEATPAALPRPRDGRLHAAQHLALPHEVLPCLEHQVG